MDNKWCDVHIKEELFGSFWSFNDDIMFDIFSEDESYSCDVTINDKVFSLVKNMPLDECKNICESVAKIINVFTQTN